MGENRAEIGGITFTGAITVNGPMFDIHDNQNVYINNEKAKHGSTPAKPELLKSEKAEELMEDLVDAGILTEDWQPNGLSGSERGLVARAVCDSLKVDEVWQVFGLLWNEKPETLRSYFNKALEQRKSLLFQEKLKRIIS